MKICNRPPFWTRYLALVCLFSLAACSNLQTAKESATHKTPAPAPVAKTKTKKEDNNKPEEKAEANLWEELPKGFGLPQVEDSKVSNYLRWYSNNQRYIDKIAEQSKPYLYYVKSELAANNMPLELALLPIVESAYNPLANSPSKAAGIWQFMPHTGRSFGLQQNQWYDGRRDLVASTDAAIRYLSRLHNMFDGDWFLAIAAYNAGEGTVKRAIAKNQRAGKKADFWSLPLSQQTQSYVPQLLALSKVVATPHKYDLSFQPIVDAPYFTRIDIPGPIDMAQAARIANLNPQDLRLLNAGHIKWITAAPGTKELLVPVADAPALALALEQLPTLGPIKTESNYRVKSGDTLGAIARRFGTSVAAIQKVNHLTNTNLRIGQELAIPGQAIIESSYIAQIEKELAAKQSQAVTNRYYTVKSGDNLWSIAKKHGVKLASLLKWNKLDAKSALKPGQKLVVAQSAGYATSKDGKITYRIQPGDTLYTIASRFDVSQKDLLSWNKVKDESYIHPGQELTIYRVAQN
ncbi:lytic transglycosylase [Cellvibrio japonicus]|uniref:Lytic murein transglycosylase, putative, lmt23B n=1 Tax=Cellvibrio japonicus (strain Ueda107) TaxID=498211 RepID=B3PHQ2_CELJU|nr:LysM peptidoglycan-binding domain-containing protein [Cellvibrio japonicus]ACE85097.1 lytic murein transglycosylase, putative, lmt23B [Cellvibrio japonicus Ueda107]QEI12518.1 LysM peptidoglycan-binding domain-containing protein [Cellvibrio japonicus]QEI16092.1 LysM peptidoglycan-binding domain-containing protein [Cellvibrio japonicus]QEI19670.1 LysM peptidoglycan-binding domain-containing protein [Cellvibrio japonicus]